MFWRKERAGVDLVLLGEGDGGTELLGGRGGRARGYW